MTNNTVELASILTPIITNIYQNSDNKQALLIAENIDDNTSIGTMTHSTHWEKVNPLQIIERQFDQKYPLALVIVTNNLSKKILFEQSIQKCRDLFGQYCLVLLPIDSQINLTAMGFSLLTKDFVSFATTDLQNASYQLWQFNLFDYKQVPDWFNSKFWANPELWDKFRW